MAGPTCSVLLPEPFGRRRQAELLRLLDDAGWTDPDQLFAEVTPVENGSDPYELSELEQLELAFGWRPQAQIVCISMIGTDPHYHHLLAQGALRLAEALCGVIDLGGVLPHTLDNAGRRVSIKYQTWSGGQAAYWVVDAMWLSVWKSHPEFRMVK